MAISIRIKELDKGPHRQRAALDTDWCAADLGGAYTPAAEQLVVNVRATRAGTVIEVVAEVRGGFRFACSRCAAPADLEVETEFTHHFVTAGSLDQGDVGDRPFEADPDISEHDGDQIQLRDLCIEHTILALPSYPLCDETCKGLCGACGVNLNEETCNCAQQVDPYSPWAVLAKLETEPSS